MGDPYAPQSDLPSQQINAPAPYYPDNVRGDVSPNTPINPPGTIAAPGFVVSTYDAMLLDSQRLTLTNNAQGNINDAILSVDEIDYTVPDGFVDVLRSLTITLYMRSDQDPPYLPGTLPITTLRGFSNQAFAVILDVLIDGVGAAGLSQFPLSEAIFGTEIIPMYVPVGSNSNVVVRITNVSDPTYVVNFEGAYIQLAFDRLTQTGVALSSEPASRQPVLVRPAIIRNTG